MADGDAVPAVDDKHHNRFDSFVCAQAEHGLRLITTWPCILEAAYILDAPQRFEMVRWIELGGAQVYLFEAHQLGDMVGWMRRYTEKTKREMDFADASLHWVAVVTGVSEILTTDVADFTRYQLPDGQTFTLL